MAAMTCPAHGGPQPGPNCREPGCPEFLVPLAAAVGPVLSCGEPGCGMAPPCPLHGEATTAGPPPDPSLDMLVHDVIHEPLPVRAAQLVFDWGAVRIADRGLVVGRDHAAECGAEICAHTNVSRSHARLCVRDGRVYVTDLRSTNGTTVNGVRIAAGEEVAISDRDVLGFGADVRAVLSVDPA